MIMERTDSELISDYQAGNQSSFDLLVSRHLKLVYLFIMRLVGNSGEVEDLTQETFVKVWKNLDKYDQRQDFKNWILKIAKNTTYDWFRKKKSVNFSDLTRMDEEKFEDTLPDPALLPDAIFAQKELGTHLTKALDMIAVPGRTILVLHLEDGLTFEEIAKIVDRPMNTVKSQYRRALLSLREFLLKNAPN